MNQDTEKRKNKNSIAVYILLIIIIISQLVYSTYVFAVKKQGYHSDEVYSYGLANSYYQPFLNLKDGIFIDDTHNIEDYVNYKELIDGKVMNDYITVQKGERFSYDSVYHNQTLDHHPPLYYVVLHTVCSFFPDSFSRYYAFVLNLVFMAFTQIFLFKLTKLICKADAPALCCCLLYGAGTGALSTVIFLRQYCLITMLLTMFVYFGALANERITGSDDKSPVKALVGMGISGLCLFLTNYSVIAFCGVFTALMCVYLLCRKKIKYMFIYGATVLAALLVSFAVFPYVFKHVFGYSDGSSSTEKAFSFTTSFYRVCHYVFSQSLGIGFSIYKSSKGAMFFAIVVMAAAVCMPLCFLFRKEEWFRRMVGSLKRTVKSIPAWLRRANYVPLIVTICIIVQIAVTAVIVDVVSMSVFSRRYIFMLYPLCCVIAVSAISLIVKHLPKIKKHYAVVVLAACVFMAAVTNVKYPSYFYFIHSDKYTDVDKLTSNKNVFVILPGKQANICWTLSYYCPYLKDCNKVYFSSNIISENDIEACKDIVIDYVIAPLDYFRLNDMSDEEYNELIAPRSTGDDGPSTEAPVADVRVGGNESSTEANIKKLNGGSEFEPLFIMDIQRLNVLVCKLK